MTELRIKPIIPRPFESLIIEYDSPLEAIAKYLFQIRPSAEELPVPSADSSLTDLSSLLSDRDDLGQDLAAAIALRPTNGSRQIGGDSLRAIITSTARTSPTQRNSLGEVYMSNGLDRCLIQYSSQHSNDQIFGFVYGVVATYYGFTFTLLLAAEMIENPTTPFSVHPMFKFGDFLDDNRILQRVGVIRTSGQSYSPSPTDRYVVTMANDQRESLLFLIAKHPHEEIPQGSVAIYTGRHLTKIRYTVLSSDTDKKLGVSELLPINPTTTSGKVIYSR